MQDTPPINDGEVPSDFDMLPDAKGSRWLRRRLASGVAVATTVADALYRGATVTSHAHVSTEPPMLLISVEIESQMAGWIQQTGFFALSILARDQQFYADQFAGFAPLASSTFRDIHHVVAGSGAPILAGCIAWADCRVVSSLVTGDHRCFVGKIQTIGAGSGDEAAPLLYYLNRYRGIGIDTRRKT